MERSWVSWKSQSDQNCKFFQMKCHLHDNRAASKLQTGIYDSPVHRIFGGFVRSSLKSLGGKESVTRAPILTLQLGIEDTSIKSIHDALLAHFITENIDDYELNGQKVPTTKTTNVESLPPILILHLKRFGYTEGVQKVMKHIHYPSTLEITNGLIF